MEGQWTLVSSDKSKKKVNGQVKQSKAEKKRILENMPHANFRDPMVSAQLDLHKKRGKNIKGDDNEIEFKPVHKSPKHTKPKKQPQQNQTKKTAEQTLASLDGSYIKELYDRFNTAFPDQPTIRLSDLAAHINREFDSDSEKDCTYAQYPSDFPMNSVKSDALKALNSIVGKQTKSTLTDFFKFSLNQILQENTKDLPTFGYRLLIQLILRSHPTIALSTIPQFVDLMKKCKASPSRFLMLAWCFGQASRVNFDVGCRVLMDLLMPFVGTKGISDYVLQFAEDLLRQQNPPTDTLSYCDFIPFLDLVFALPTSQPTSLPGNVPEPVIKKLKKLYPKFKKYAFLEQSSKNYKNYFPSLFYRLDPAGPTELKNELLSCLTHCLIKNSQCFLDLMQLHPGSEEKTNLLLCHLVKNWNTLRNQIKGQDFDTALKFFVSDLTDSNSIQDKVSINGQILLESRRPGKGMKCINFLANVILILMMGVCILLAVDILQNKGVWERTRSHKLLVDLKMMPFIESFGKRCHALYLEGRTVAMRVWQYSLPYIMALYGNASAALRHIWVKCEPMINTLWEKAAPVITLMKREVDKIWPYMLEKLAQFGHQIMDTASMLLDTILVNVQRIDWKSIVEYFEKFRSSAIRYISVAMEKISSAISN